MDKEAEMAEIIIEEQIIEDAITGLKFEFVKLETGNSELRISGPALRERGVASRDFAFNEQGREYGRGISPAEKAAV